MKSPCRDGRATRNRRDTSRTACSASEALAVACGEYTRHMMRTTLTTVMMALFLLAFGSIKLPLAPQAVTYAARVPPLTQPAEETSTLR